MKIIEQFIKGKKENQDLCEDRLLVTNNFIAVIDGVTAKSSNTINGKTGGKLGADVLFDTIQKLPKDVTVYDAVKHLTDAIATLYSPCEEKGWIAACAIIYSAHHKEIWNIGDCQCIINDSLFSHEKEIDRLLSKKRADVINEALKNGMSEEEFFAKDVGREAILSQLKEQHKLANGDGEYAYPVFNGTEIPPKMIETYKVETGDTIILASDGYPFLCNTLEESELLLQKELKENPLCYKSYKSTKGLQKGNVSFDDRAYIKFTV